MIFKTALAAMLATAAFSMPAQAPATAPIDDSAVLVSRTKQAPLKARINPRAYVRATARSAGYTLAEWKCLDAIITRESRWNPNADNPTSTAFGLFQQLRLHPTSNVQKQTRLGLQYIAKRYGTACVALAHHNENGWY